MKKTFLILKSSALKSTGVHTVQQLAYRADMHVHIFESSQLEGSYLRGLLYSKQSRYLKFLSYSLLAHICLYISYFPCLITFPTSLSWKEISFKTQQVSGLLKSLLCPSQRESPPQRVHCLRLVVNTSGAMMSFLTSTPQIIHRIYSLNF